MRAHLTAEQRQLALRLKARGLSLREIGPQVGCSHQGVALIVRQPSRRPVHPDGWVPGPGRLTVADREEITPGLHAGESFTVIAARLGKATSTVSREVAANGGRTEYRAWRAHQRARQQARRPKVPKLARPELAGQVSSWLAEWWPPVQISRRLRIEFPGDPMMRVSHETIYQALYVQGRGELRRELARCLRTGRARRRPHGRGENTGRIKDMVMISERPAEAADRAVPGHWEGDLIIGKDCRSAVGTLVERTSRYVLLLHLPEGRDAHLVEQAMQQAITTLPAELARTITWDQGKEMAYHADFTIAAGIPVYFCDPHAPWQGGSNENTNGLLRQPPRSFARWCLCRIWPEEPGPLAAWRLGEGIDLGVWGWWAGGVAGPVAFVGREGELSRLVGALGGDARMVLVVGDAGVGKTRFAGEGMARAAAAGVVMVRGECLPLAGTLPLLPVAQALRELGALEGGRLLEEALAAGPAYAREEVGRLLPRLGPGEGPGPGDRGEGWRRERLFSAVADLLEAVARESGARLGLVVEDVHWADSATLDCLTFLARTVRRGAVTLVATCRSDEAPVAPAVAGWLAHVRGAADVEEIQLGPLPRAEVAEQVAALAGGPVPPRVVDELYARAEGNPFFTEQLVAAALPGSAGGELRVPAGLPGRLAGLLAARAERCAGDARVVLAALAVAGRPLPEDLLGEVSGLGAAAVRGGLRELAAARLLAEDSPGGAHRARHALLAEAVAAGLLPGERAALHERTARALQAAAGDTLAAEAAGHWQAAGRPAGELPARIAAAAAAERVFGYAQAAVHWQRAIELVQALPEGAAPIPGAELPRLYLRAVDAADKSGDMQQAGLLAEHAYQLFAGHPDPATAAAIHRRAGTYRAGHAPEAARPLFEESLRLFELAAPSAEHAEALSWYGTFLVSSYGRWQDNHTLQLRAAEIAEAAGATAVLGRILADLAGYEFFASDAEEWLALIQRARRAAEASGDSMAVLAVDGYESANMLVSGDFAGAEQVAVRGLRAARRAGLANWSNTANLAENAATAIWSQGHTADAAALIEPLTTGPPRADDWPLHGHRAFLDMLRGDLQAAAARQRQVSPLTGLWGHDHAAFTAELTAEVALWAGRPGDALAQVRQAVAPYEDVPALTTDFGRLLAAGLRACADLAEQARARRDDPAVHAARASARELACVAEAMEQVPFTDHPHVAAIPAARATWQAEQTRLAGASDPAAWAAAAKTWQSLGCPHRAGYAFWRQAQALLDAGQPAATAAAALRAAAVAADGHAPLLAQIRALAQRARIPLQAPPTAPGDTAPAPPPPAPYGLTERELAVLRLVAAGRTNAQIGAELYISPTTARVHVSNILRKLGVTSRVQAAAVAERAGLLRPGPP